MLRYLKYSSCRELVEKLTRLGFSKQGVDRFTGARVECVFVGRGYDLENEWRDTFLKENTNIILEDGKVAVSVPWRWTNGHIEETEVDGLSVLRTAVREAIERFSRVPGILRLRGREFDLQREGVLIMGVVNVTPDSFSDGGRFFERERAVDRALSLVEEGAHIIDVGGESTRPGAEPVSEEEELARVIPVVEKIAKETNAVISVDTYKSSVARVALEAGAHMINDISGLRFSRDMGDVVAAYRAGIVIMHIKGEPRSMQANPQYDSFADEVIEYLAEGVDRAENAGVPEESIVVDPGIGFGKRYEDNLYVLRNVEEFASLGYPLLIGTSRKSFIGVATGRDVSERIFGTAASVALAVAGGARIVRVHDVREMRDVVALARAVRWSGV